jgi:hypothetical protein
VRWNDAVTVGPITVAGEDPATPGLTAIVSGTPTGEALRNNGIRYVLLENGQPPAPDLSALDATRVYAGRDLTLYRLDGAVAPQPAPVRAPALVIIADLGVSAAALWCAFRLLVGKLRHRVRQAA